MIRKLAEELAFNDIVPGGGDVAPLVEGAPPAMKDDATPSPNYGFTEHGKNRHALTNHGFLSRALDNYDLVVSDHDRVLSDALGGHVHKVTGSSMLSQKAVQRFRNRQR